MAVYICGCGDLKGKHRGGAYGCQVPDCGCGKYRPDFSRVEGAELERMFIRNTELIQERDEAQAKARDAEQSRKVAARRYEAELGAALQEIELLREDLDDAQAAAKEKVRGVIRAERPADAAQVHAYPALYCVTCYSRILPDTPAAETHPHPLIPVLVTITNRSEATS